jgi:hypothetical protein
MSPKIIFVPYHNTGGHFISWSLAFLAGYQYYVSRNGIKPLEFEPLLLGKNYHWHQSYLTINLQTVYSDLDLMRPDATWIVYLNSVPLIPREANIQSSENLENIIESSLTQVNTQNQKNLKQCIVNGWPVALFDFCHNDTLNIFYNDRAPMSHELHEFESKIDWLKNFQKQFYPDISKYFGKEIWQQREMYALMLKSPIHHKIQVNDLIDKTHPYLYYNTDDLWNDGVNIMPELCDFFEISFSNERFNQWRKNYRCWREIHDNSFSRHFDEIINNILHGHFMSLRRYNLDLLKEIAILRTLIHEHNLLIECWDIERFPDNTKDIHARLRENHHVI